MKVLSSKPWTKPSKADTLKPCPMAWWDNHHLGCPEGLSKGTNMSRPCCSTSTGWDLCSGWEKRRLWLRTTTEAQMHQVPGCTQGPRHPWSSGHSIQTLNLSPRCPRGMKPLLVTGFFEFSSFHTMNIRQLWFAGLKIMTMPWNILQNTIPAFQIWFTYKSCMLKFLLHMMVTVVLLMVDFYLHNQDSCLLIHHL